MTNYLEILNSMTPEDIQRIAQEANAALAGVKFIPFPGTQTRAYFSEADILLFGGKMGGGKSALINGLAIQEHYRSLLVRRNHSDLRPLIDVAKELVGSEKGFIGGGRPEYNKDDGGVIHYMGLAADGGLGGMQGEAHDLICVGPETKVLMGDGSYKAMLDVSVGDYVMTLEGRRRVAAKTKKMRKPCVKVSTRYGSQTQSVSHALLTPQGWLAYEDLFSCRIAPASPTLFHGGDISFVMFLRRIQELLKPRPCHKAHSRPFPEISQAVWETAFWGMLAFSAHTGRPTRGSGILVSDALSPILPRQALLSRFQPMLFLLRHFASFLLKTRPHSSVLCDVRDGQRTSLLEDCLGDYSAGFHPYGGRTPEFWGRGAGQVGAQLYLHQQGGAVQPNPTDSPADVPEKTHAHSARTLLYAHPYKMGERQASESVLLSSSWLLPVGVQDVYDITVEDVNHYITAGGFINKNCFDEVAQIPEDPVRTVLGWLRRTTRTKRDQRLRTVMASNPPLDSTGDWLVPFYPCWLDETYPNPAADGELRWFIRDGGVDVECKKGDSIVLDGQEVFAHSRTFIASDYTDNPYINSQEYASKLANMPEAQRRILMSGNFLLSRGDAEGQMIPTKWIQEAQARWKQEDVRGKHMVAMGADVTGGGSDNTAVARLYDGLYFGEMIVRPGTEVGTGNKQAALIIENRRGNCPVGIDMGGGYGGGPKEMLSFSGIEAYAFNPSAPTGERTKDRAYGFYNQRALAYWRLREALDPDADGGCMIALPPSKKLLSDLATPKFTTVMYGGRMVIKMESKDEIKKRIRRSPDEGDAVVIALYVYMKKGAGNGSGGFMGRARSLTVNLGHEGAKKRRRR